jgi:RNA polymerase sigma factor (sigma-70 family)
MRTHSEDGRTRGSWIALLKEGDREAWEAFLPRYTPFLVAVFRKHGLHSDDWEDVQQNLLLTLFQNIGKYEHNPLEPSFRRWLATLIRSRVVDQQRKHGRRPCPLSEEHLNQFCEQAAAECQRLAQEDWRQQQLDDILRTVERQAPPSKWEVFRLRWREGKSVEEVGQALGLPAATVMVYTSQVLALCKQEARKINFQW